MDQETSLNKFAYELIDNGAVRQYNFCCSINLNQEKTLLLASAKYLTRVYIFKMGFIKLLAQLGGHRSYVKSLKFLNNKQTFLSASSDKSIVVWPKQLLANPKYIQTIKTDYGDIVQLVLHPTIDKLFISASS